MSRVAPLRVALGEYDTGWHDPGASLARVATLAGHAKSAGARLLVLPEMCTTGFTMHTSEYAERIGGSSTQELAAIARDNDLWLIAGVALSEVSRERATNCALVIDTRGELVASYRKQRLFVYGDEHRHYEAGDEPVLVTIDGVRVAPFICYDLRFPELFRASAREAEAMVVIANWPAARRAHWDTLLRARAIENLCYVIGVNRTGTANGLDYDGGSAVISPWGEVVSEVRNGDGFSMADVDPATVERTRERYPFLDDVINDCATRA